MTNQPGQDIKARVINLKDLIAYQPAAVVSREILRQKTGSVTLFAFAAGEQLSEHTAPFDALVLVLEGHLEVMIDHQPHSLHGGDMIIMPAQQPHALRALTETKMILVMIRA